MLIILLLVFCCNYTTLFAASNDLIEETSMYTTVIETELLISKYIM